MLRVLAGLIAVLYCGVAAAGTLPEGELSAAGADVARRALRCDELLVIQQQPVMPSHVYTYHVEGLRPGGGLYRYRLPRNGGPGALTQLVNSSEGVVLDCELSFDAKTVLFSWKKTMQEPFHLFTIPVEGGQPRRLTSGDHHNFNACWLPDGGIAFLSTRNPQFAYCWNSPVGVLHRMNADGGNVRRISANYLNDFTPTVMEDGRIIYGRWEYVDRPAIPIQKLWTIHPDGTMLSGYFGNRVLGPATFIEARAIPGGSGRVLCTMTGHNGRCSGAIGIIDPRKGGNAQEAITNVTPEVDIGKVTISTNGPSSGPYQSPWPLDNRRFLVTHYPQANRFTDGAVQLRAYDGSLKLDLLPGQGELTWVCAQPVRARPRPPVIPSTLPPSPPPDVQGTAWATISMQDVYQGLEPHVKRGEVARIAVVQEIAKPVRVDPNLRAFGFQFPVVSCGATYAPKKIWGFVDVEDDGSAHFQVPANVPIYFLALDRQGRAVQRMRTFTHLMPGETQGCIGCHADRNYATFSRTGSAASKPAKTSRGSALGSAEPRLQHGGSARLGQALRAVPQPPRSACRPGPVRRPHRIFQCFLRPVGQPGREPGGTRQQVGQLDSDHERTGVEHFGRPAQGLGLAAIAAGGSGAQRPSRCPRQAAGGDDRRRAAGHSLLDRLRRALLRRRPLLAHPVARMPPNYLLAGVSEVVCRDGGAAVRRVPQGRGGGHSLARQANYERRA